MFLEDTELYVFMFGLKFQVHIRLVREGKIIEQNEV